MFSMRAAGGMVLAGGLLVGCHQPKVTNPTASALMPANEATAASLVESWQATHPGAHAGVVDAVLPARRMASVADLPANQITNGTVITILNNRQQTLVSGVVIAKSGGDVQIEYEPLAGGERDPQVGDLAVWFPGGPAVAPTMLPPGAGQPVQPPATEPAPGMPPENTTNPPPAAQPAETPAAPTTQPSGGAGATAAPSNGSEPAATGGGATPGTTAGNPPTAPAELNK